MKICFVSPTIGTSGGRERVTSNIANEFTKRGESVTFLIVNDILEKPYYPLDNNISLKLLQEGYKLSIGRKIARKICDISNMDFLPCIAKRTFYPQKQIEALTQKINEGNYDVVVSVSGDLSLLLAQVSRNSINNKNVKLIGWFHNTYDAYFGTKGKYCFGRENLARRDLKKLDYVISLTRKDANILKQKLDCNTVSIYNPLSFSTNEVSTVSNKVLLFVGRISIQQKGVDLLLDILKKIKSKDRYSEWKAIIVGDGEDKEIINKMTEEYGIDDFVFLVGSHTNVIPYYLKADILLLTSRWEGFGLVVTEAFECAVPVVSFENDGPNEIITNNVNGFLVKQYDTVDFSNKVMYLMDNADIRKNMSKNARKRADDFSIESVLKRWEDICK